MSGAALTPVPPSARGSEDASDELFTGLVVSNPRKAQRSLIMPASLAGHLIVIALLLLIPVLWPTALPEERDRIVALIYNPPPPPPPPLPKGQALVEKAQPTKPVTPETQPEKKPEFTAQIERPDETPLKPEARDPDTEQVGSLTGSDMGLPEGMEEGVEGGVVGGTPGGVIGGVIGGTGDGPVLDYDQPPRVLRQTKPIYPQEAFVKKIEGVVELEVIIDASGRVSVRRIIHSVPVLDAAAMNTVRQWLFSPAVKNGRPVATVALIPVSFRIY
ncbi:MAG TPA: TonB family protein [Vicinamibacteria bacterium]|nr:TonB family protein [Vicinamibacteria bacterium]